MLSKDINELTLDGLLEFIQSRDEKLFYKGLRVKDSKGFSLKKEEVTLEDPMCILGLLGFHYLNNAWYLGFSVSEANIKKALSKILNRDIIEAKLLPQFGEDNYFFDTEDALAVINNCEYPQFGSNPKECLVNFLNQYKIWEKDELLQEV